MEKAKTTISEQNGWSPIRDGNVFFRQDQLYYVNKLSQTIRKETGIRYKFKSPDEIMHLLTVASESSNKNVKEAFAQTVSTFSKELQKFFNLY